MKRLTLTSPGVLLILAVLATAAIFLLDLFWLHPYIDAQKWSALREEATRSERAVQGALRQEAETLGTCAAAWAGGGQFAGAAAGRDAGGPERWLSEAMPAAGVDVVWLAGADGQVRRWSFEAAEGQLPAALRRDAVDRQERQLVETARTTAAEGEGGLLRLPGGLVVVAAAAVLPAGADGGAGGAIVVGRGLSGPVTARLGACAGGEVVLVGGEAMPRGTLADGAAAHAVWLASEDRLATAWVATDTAGQTLGYFRAVVPVMHIHRQAVTSRRSILITLSLSVGLALLVILGTHMLITGPVVRLLARLQRLDAGQGDHKELTHNLHGEPLMLARRLENAFEKLAYISKTDELTGLANRRHFEEVLEAFYYQARRYNRPLSVMVMDIDFFKAVNDTGGHAAGDNVLREFAVAVEDACRRADLPARFGGDEFAVLLPETLAEDAAAVAERIRGSLGRQKVRAKNLDMNITVSMGIADLNAGEMDGPGAMMALADRALYAAKQRGRDRVVQAHDLDGPLAAGQSESGKVDLLSKKLAGLDSEFKDLFLRAIEVVMEILQQRDPHMADHSMKVQHYATLIAQEMELPPRVIKRLEIAAMLHDIGMLALNDAILLCPSELAEDQHAMMRRHPLLSVRIMERMEFLEQEVPAVRYHHERYDGKGYPEGIAGPAIPLSARILAVADAFDAMTSPRTFRQARSVSEAIGEIRAGSGTQFDPTVVSAFMSVADRAGAKLIEVPGVDGHEGQEAQGGAGDQAAAPQSRWRSASFAGQVTAAIAEAVEADRADQAARADA